jgi:hypothetical protein
MQDQEEGGSGRAGWLRLAVEYLQVDIGSGLRSLGTERFLLFRIKQRYVVNNDFMMLKVAQHVERN